MIPLDRRETGSPRSCGLLKLLGKEVAKSSPGLSVSNLNTPRLFYMAHLPAPLGILISPFPVWICPLEYQHSLPASLVRIKEDSIFELFYKTKPTSAQGNEIWT